MSDNSVDPLEDPIFKPYWPDGLEMNELYEAWCDDRGADGKVRMTVVISEDGDANVFMQDWEDCPEGNPYPFPSIRIRTLHGGGRNMRTRQALLWLAQAIRLDSIDNRQNDSSRG